MTPRDLHLAIGSIIAEETHCTRIWDFVDGSKPLQMCGPVTPEQRRKIYERILFEAMLDGPKVVLGPQLVGSK